MKLRVKADLPACIIMGSLEGNLPFQALVSFLKYGPNPRSASESSTVAIAMAAFKEWADD